MNKVSGTMVVILTCLLLSYGFCATFTSFTINNGSRYTNSLKLVLSLNATASEMRFSCDKNNWTEWFNYSNTAEFTLSPKYGCSIEDGNKIIYAQVRDADGNAELNSWIVLDRTEPSKPRNLIAKRDGNSITLSWSASIDSSGIEKYLIFVEERWKEIKNYYAHVDGNQTRWQHSASERRKYCYKILAIDKAGNSSPYSDETCVLTASTPPEIEIVLLDSEGNSRDINGTSYFSSEEVLIKVLSDVDLNTVSGYITLGSEKEGLSFTGSGKEFIATYKLKSFNGTAKVYVLAKDYLDFNSEAEKSFVVDSVKPELDLEKVVQISDRSILLKASFSTDVTKLYLRMLGKLYLFEDFSIDANTNKAYLETEVDISDAKEEIIKASLTAEDRAKNTTTLDFEIIVLLNAHEKVKDIKRLKEFIEQYLEEIRKLALVEQPEVEAELAANSALIANIEEDIEKKRYANARSLIKKVKRSLEEIYQKRIIINIIEKLDINYQEDKEVYYSELSGYFERIPKDVKELWNSLAISREISKVEIIKDGNRYFRVVVKLTIKNLNDSSLGPFWVIEFIPKRISKTFSDVNANTVMKLRKDDPIVAIPVRELSSSDVFEVIYAGPLTESARESFQVNPDDFFIPVPTRNPSTNVNFVHVYQKPSLAPLAIALIIMASLYLFYRRVKK